jgi:hypothetical protein
VQPANAFTGFCQRSFIPSGSEMILREYDSRVDDTSIAEANRSPIHLSKYTRENKNEEQKERIKIT